MRRLVGLGFAALAVVAGGFAVVDISEQVAADLKFRGAVGVPGKVIFAPDYADGVGVYDPDSKDFELVDISEQIATDRKFRGAVGVPRGKVIFAPYDADGVGAYDPDSKDFELVDISEQVEGDSKFSGAVVAPSGKVIFAPYDADGVGVYDPDSKDFELVDISEQIEGGTKFMGAVVVPGGQVISAPNDADGVGVYDPDSQRFQKVDISEQIAGSPMLSGAVVVPGGKVIFAPWHADGVGVYDPHSKRFELVDISEQMATDWKFVGAVGVPGGKVIFTPDNADGVGVYDPDSKRFYVVDMWEQIATERKFSGAVVVPGGMVIFAPSSADTVGILTTWCRLGCAECAHDDNCTRCPGGFHPADREYIVNTCECDNGSPTAAECADDGTLICVQCHGAQINVQCHGGYHFADREFTVKKYGSSAKRAECEDDGAYVCTRCEPGRYLQDHACLAQDCASFYDIKLTVLAIDETPLDEELHLCKISVVGDRCRFPGRCLAPRVHKKALFVKGAGLVTSRAPPWVGMLSATLMFWIPTTTIPSISAPWQLKAEALLMLLVGSALQTVRLLHIQGMLVRYRAFFGISAPEDALPEPATLVSSRAYHRTLIVEIAMECALALVVNILNHFLKQQAQLTSGWFPVGQLSIALSVYMLLRFGYKYAFHILWLREPLGQIPLPGHLGAASLIEGSAGIAFVGMGGQVLMAVEGIRGHATALPLP